MKQPAKKKRKSGPSGPSGASGVHKEPRYIISPEYPGQFQEWDQEAAEHGLSRVGLVRAKMKIPLPKK